MRQALTRMLMAFIMTLAALILINLAASHMAGASCEPTTKADR
jgi:hypothetical protein